MAAEKEQQNQDVRLDHKRVLLVEDEYYIADDLSRAVSGAGAEVLGPYATTSRATDAIAKERFDCAIIDLNLRGESAVPIAERLLELSIPFAIATGYGSHAVPPHLSHVLRVEKPFDPRILLELVAQLTAPAEA
jgi:DNA-binding NtrC family response regulator